MWQALQESDFNLEIAEIYMDLTSYATASMIEEYNNDRLDFTAVPLKECFFEEGADGQPLIFFRILNWTYLQILDKFGADGVPSYVKDKAENVQGSAERARVFFCIYPRVANPKPTYKTLPPKRRPWGFKYILENDSAMLGKEGGYHEMPASIVRWSKISESRWGHGPSHIAVYDAKTLNRQEELMLQYLAKAIDPPMKTTERGLIGDLDMGPGGLTVVKNMDELQPLNEGQESRIVMEERENRRTMIREYYFASRLDMKESPAMTATEVERRWQQMQKLLGPTLGRLQAELLDPIIKITFSILYRADRLPAMPTSLEGQKANLDIEYIGPIPMAQKKGIADSIENEMAFAAATSEAFGPEALDAIDAPKAVREHAFYSGVPAKIIRSEAEMAKKRKEREAKQAEVEQATKAASGADTTQKMGAAMKSMSDAGLPIDQMPGGGGALPPESVPSEMMGEAGGQ
jgi:hypothetical protein